MRSAFLFLQFSLPKRGSVAWTLPPSCIEDDGTGEIHQFYREMCQVDAAALELLSKEERRTCAYNEEMGYYSNFVIHYAILHELVMSLANLYVAVEADGWVGTLTSNWCSMTAKLVRSRGDGGGEYHSVDRGSFYTNCFT